VRAIAEIGRTRRQARLDTAKAAPAGRPGAGPPRHRPVAPPARLVYALPEGTNRE
jgi:hypothetical protein